MKKNFIIGVLVFLVIILSISTFYFWVKFNTLSMCKNTENKSKVISEVKDEEYKIESDLPEGNFKKITNEFGDELLEGDLYLKGYFKELKERDGFENKFNQVIFCVDNFGKKNEFTDFLGFGKNYEGNYFYLGNNCFSLGCLDKDQTINTSRILINSSKDVINDKLSKDDSYKILNSSIENQIILHVEAKDLGTSLGAPDCYSIFNKKIEVYKK